MDDMATPVSRNPRASDPTIPALDGRASAVSWAAIFAGAAGAAALSLILLILGTGLGLSSVSPWATRGVAASTFGVSTIVWISFVQLAASGTGGYLAGRLRTRWAGAHADEVYFRDTAHGFLAWAVATLATAALLTSTITSIIGTGVEAGSSVVGAAGSAATVAAAGGAGAMAAAAKPEASTSSEMPGLGYFTDLLFRPNAAPGAAAPASGAAAPSTMSPGASTGASTAEVGRIFLRSLQSGTLAPEDVTYIGQLVAQRIGMSQQDAEKRVADTYAKARAALQEAETRAKDAADKARKAAAYGALWLFVSLLLGAFVASWAATFGGRQRDL